MVILNNIYKTYNKGNTKAVTDVSLSIKDGELFGLIGPDGAGKTSLFRILTTLLLADNGTASVNGFDVVKDYRHIRKSVGYMPGRFSLYQDLTVKENLDFFATLFNTTVDENYHLIKDIYIQIERFKDRRAGQLSGGMKQKLALCCALIHKPTTLFLDEPTTGVDPVSRKEFWEMLKRLKEQGITIMVATPYMDEANLCDRIALMQNGHILSVDTPAEITAAYTDILFAVRANDMYSLLNCLKEYPDNTGCYAFGEYAHLSLTVVDSHTENNIREFMKNKQIEVTEIKKIKPTIEDAFIKLMVTHNT